MGQVSNQLTLPIGLKETESFGSFIPGQNIQVCSYLKDLFTLIETEQSKCWLTYLFSDSGLGKSHLLYATCQQAELAGQSSIYLSFKEKQHMSPDVLQGLEQYHLICLDDIEKLQGETTWQIAVFDLINRVKEQSDSCLVITGNKPSNQLSLELPDLLSRLSWGTNFQLYSLTDDQRQEALIVKAQHRGLNMSKEVAKYLVNHRQRDMPALVESLDILDEQSMQQQRKLTIPFVKAIFDF